MAFHATDLMPTAEDDFVDPPVAAFRPALRAQRRRITVEALAWGALVVLAFGPVIGYLLATLL